MLKIESRRWVAIVLRCPRCGATSGELMLTPYQYAHRRTRQCYGYKCDNVGLEVIERRWYTTFAIEVGLSRTVMAGTLGAIGPFKLCDIVEPNIRVFRRWYRLRKAEEDAKARAYFEREAAYRARLARQQQEAALLKEAEAVAYRRNHATELAAEQVALAAWPVEENRPARSSCPATALDDNDFDPFLDIDE